MDDLRITIGADGIGLDVQPFINRLALSMFVAMFLAMLLALIIAPKISR